MESFTFLVDFMIFDMEVDIKVPIILGKLFFATARAIIDVGNKKLTLWVKDEELMVKVSTVIKQLVS